MPVSIVMPKNGMTMTEGMIVKWHKQEGDTVAAGEPLVEVMSDKVNVLVESPAAGMLVKILYREGSVAPVFEMIALLTVPGDDGVPAANAGPVKKTTAVFGREVTFIHQPAEEEAAVKASPLARKMAKEHGVDLGMVKGTGPGGRIKEKDIENYLEMRNGAAFRPVPESPAAPDAPSLQAAEQPAPPVAPLRPAPVHPAAPAAPPHREETGEETISFTGLRKVIADNLKQSYDTAVHVTSTTSVDLTELVELRQKLAPLWKKRHDVNLTYTAFFVKAVAAALPEHPSLNAAVFEDRIVRKNYYHIGVAMTLDHGLLVPVVRNADRLTVLDLARIIEEKIRKAGEGTLTGDDMAGGTFTISNVGPEDVEIFTPLIVRPQAAILGISSILTKPAFYKGQIALRKMAYLCLSYDHRAVDGVPGARFRRAVKELLECPHLLLS
ncbi:MAG: dihydrolipoamide acetyltransferase family protein [Eubacteriales bacterium]